MTDDRPPAPAASLEWGVKQSFRTYVEAAGGVIEAGGGAERGADGAFTFAGAPGGGLTLDANGRPEGQARFLGEVRFEAHGGLLSVFLADPIVEIGTSGAILTVADSPARTRRVELAQLDPAAITVGESGEIVIPAALAMDGIQLLGDHYSLMTALDPLRVRLARR
jgi:hypothetical protein